MPSICFCVVAIVLSVVSALATANPFPSLAKPNSIGGGENDAAVVVAIEDYAFLPDVKGAEINGRDWYLYFTRGLNIPAERVIFLRNEEATKEDISSSVEKLSALKKPNGKLWFVFIGHGAPNPKGDGQGVLVGVDTQQNPNSLVSRGVSQETILGTLDAATEHQNEAVVVIDACFSGKSSTGDDLVPGLQPVLIAPNVNNKLVVLSAALNNEFAGPLPDNSRPAYSYLALGALQGWGDANDDGSVDTTELTNYVNQSTRILIKGRTQTANQRSSGSVMLAESGKNSGPDWVDFISAARPQPTAELTTRNQRSGLVSASFRLTRTNFSELQTNVNADVTAQDSFFSGSTRTETKEVDLAIDSESPDVGSSLIGAHVELVLGDRGFVVGAQFGFAATSEQLAVTVRDTDNFSNFENLKRGVAGTIDSLVIVDLGMTVGYRAGLGRFTIWPKMGLGAQLLPMKVSFTTDGNPNTINAVPIRFDLPVGVNVGFDLSRNVHLMTALNYNLFPSGQFSALFGGGVYF